MLSEHNEPHGCGKYCREETVLRFMPRECQGKPGLKFWDILGLKSQPEAALIHSHAARFCPCSTAY
jgi:hypothetical protein